MMTPLKAEDLQLLKRKLGDKFFLFHGIAQDPGTANRQVSISGLITLNKGLDEADFCKIVDKHSKILLYMGDGLRTAIHPGCDTLSFEFSERGGIDDYESKFDELYSQLKKLKYRASGSIHITDDFGSTKVKLYLDGKGESVLYHAYEGRNRDAC